MLPIDLSAIDISNRGIDSSPPIRGTKTTNLTEGLSLIRKQSTMSFTYPITSSDEKADKTQKIPN